MPDKKNEELNEEEMNAASGGAGYNISGSKTGNRSNLEHGTRSATPDPLGPPTSTGTDPVDPTVKP
jgi:hypothetical protein